jgi:membrane protein implicated in regulation of membrane protease activity
MELLIYIICLVVGFVFTILTAVFGHVFGHGHDGPVGGSGGHAESGADNSDMPGISAFSPTVIATFVTAFGAMGIIFSQIEATKKPWASAPLAVLGATVIASAVLWFLRLLFGKTQGSSESRVSTLVGQVATIITPIPENGVGEIAYVQGGTRYSAPARAETGKPLPVGSSVTIRRVVGSQFYVVPTQVEPL